MSNNNKIGGLAQFLSSATLNGAQQSVKAEDVVKIDIDMLVPDPYNMYGLRDIEGLAGMIASNHFHVEAIEVRPIADNKYMIISGHRRRAAWEMLLNNGETEERTLPCIVRRFEDTHFQVDNNGVTEDKVITAEQQANIALILANRGQRQEKTIEEELWEIQQLEPYVRIWYKSGRPKERGTFKSFFASVLNLNPATLQRKKNLLRLTPYARLKLKDREINLSVAVELSGLPKEEQEIVLDLMAEQKMENTYAAVVEYKKNLKGDEDNASEEPQVENTEEDVPEGSESEPDSFPSGSSGSELDSGESQKTFTFTEENPSDAGYDSTEDTEEEDFGQEIEDEEEYGSDDGGRPDTARNEAREHKEDKPDNVVPEPPDTGNPQNDVHKWFMGIISPEIARLERIKAYCSRMKEELEASDEKGAALKAARWDSCRSYVTLKILALKEKD